MDKMVRILVAVELPVDVEAVKSAIDRRPGGCDFLVTKTLAEFSAALESFKPVVIVADYHLTRFDGMAALKLARKRFPGIPFVFIVNSIDEMNDSAYCEDECWDHISKARLDQLGFLIQNILAAYTRLKIGTKVSRTAFMKRERQLITLMQNLPGMVFQCRNDRAWTMEFVNEGSFSLTGYHPEELENNAVATFADLIHPADRDKIWHTIQDALCRGVQYQISYRLFTRGGVERWVWEQGIGVWMNGSWHLEGFIWDITDHKLAEKALQENDEKLRLFMKHTHSLVAILDHEGRYEYVSPSHQLLLGYSPEDLLTRSGFDVIASDDFNQMADALTKAVSGEISSVFGMKYRMLDKNGKIHFLQGNFDTIRDEQDRLKHVICVGNDITGHLEIESELQQERNKFQFFVEEMPLGILLLEAVGRVAYVNPTFTDIFGYVQGDIPTEEEWLEKVFPSEEYRDQVILSWRENSDQSGWGGAAGKHIITCKDGAEKTVQFSCVVLLSGDQLIICQDLTHQVELEAQFMHAQKMESVGRLASGIAHDFNNLLTAIIGNADFVLMDLEQNDSFYEIVKDIKDAAERAGELTSQLLTFSRKQNVNPENLDLNEKVLETRNMLQRLIGEDITLHLALSSDLKTIKIDPGQLGQVIMNLAVNARDAMPSGGKLTIKTADVVLKADDEHIPAGLVPGGYVLLSIADSGTGISKDIQQQIFDPFFTTKSKGKGTGLGLSTVYGIVKQNRGNILIDSETGEGTTVNLYFPGYADTVSQKVETVADAEVQNLQGDETILLVDDEARVRAFVRMVLQKYGYSVIDAGDARTALKLFQTHYRPIQVLLTDLVMPEMDGLELIRALHEIRPDLTVLCMSGFTNEKLYETIQKEGIPFIPKPFQARELIQKIRQLLDEK